MLALGFMGWMLSLGIVAISVLLIGIILLQKNKGSGLSGAFGGVGGHSAFGTKTGDFLTWFTVGLAVLFLMMCIAGNFAFEPSSTTPIGANAQLIDVEDGGEGATDTGGDGSATDSSDDESAKD
jgi:preprotein translocase subunit SecG